MKPIIFNGNSVRGILAGRKTMTRRLRGLKEQPIRDTDGMWHWKDCQWMEGGLGFPQSGVEDYAPWHTGDVLWVRERWTSVCLNGGRTDAFAYEADGALLYPVDGMLKISGSKAYLIDGVLQISGSKVSDLYPSAVRLWQSPMFMPKAAARIFLRVTDVCLERLQDMTPEDCANDGDFAPETVDALGVAPLFGPLWDGINGKRDGGAYAWDKNPWVWRVKFERS